MVSTRHHPRPFPEPTLAPSRTPNGNNGTPTPSREKEITSPSPAEPTSTTKKRSTSTRRKSTASSLNGPNVGTATTTPSKPASSSSSLTRTRSTTTTSSRRKSSRAHFIHTPTPLALIWLFISLPLVIWDTGYVLLRPHTFPGGFLAWPIWQPYALYGKVDYIYGLPAWKARNGFTAAQASMNMVETLGYIYYLVVVGREVEGGWSGIFEGLTDAVRGRSRLDSRGDLRVWGKGVEIATLVCFSTCVMTVSKTVLYGLNEAFSSFQNIGHNSITQLIFLWIIPNGAWLVFPTIMAVRLGREIVEGLRGFKEE